MAVHLYPIVLTWSWQPDGGAPMRGDGRYRLNAQVQGIFNAPTFPVTACVEGGKATLDVTDDNCGIVLETLVPGARLTLSEGAKLVGGCELTGPKVATNDKGEVIHPTHPHPAHSPSTDPVPHPVSTPEPKPLKGGMTPAK